MSRKNGGIIGPANTPVGGLMSGVAGGVWRMNDLLDFVGNSQWPSTPKDIENSTRFNGSGSDDYLSKTFGSDGNRKIYTVSAWVKRAELGRTQVIFFAGDNSTDSYPLHFVAGDNLEVTRYAGGYTFRVTTTRVFRDLSAWYHIVVAVDTTQATASNRVKIYVNGVQETAFDNSSYPTQDSEYEINDASFQHNWGFQTTSNDFDYGGYMAECVFIDGQALDATSFGEFDSTTGIWKPKKIGQQFAAGGGAGTNGFYLDFKDSSNLGNDASGNNNDFTVNNLTSIDQSTDTCVENFATLNPLVTYAATPPVHSEGNLQVVTVNADPGLFGSSSTIGVSQGKWYAEFKPTNSTSGVPYLIGISSDPAEMARNGATAGNQYSSTEWGYYAHNGNQYHEGSNSSYGDAYTTNDIIGVALDLDNHKLYFSKNGTFQNSGVPTSGSTGTGAISIDSGETYFFMLTDLGGGVCTFQANFGSPPFSISSGNSDANGFGNFEYSVPSGFFALNTSNLNTYG